jgi:hypothetical protein
MVCDEEMCRLRAKTVPDKMSRATSVTRRMPMVKRMSFTDTIQARIALFNFCTQVPSSVHCIVVV